MKLTNRQKQEIEYLKTWNKSNIEITDEHIEEFINISVKGRKENKGKFSTNPLIQAQQRLGITLALWKEDMVNGLISVSELLDDATCEYEKNLILSTRDSVSANYRRKHMTSGTVLSMTNFPKVMKTLKENDK